MKILYVGDVVGDPGLVVVEKILPGLRKSQHIDTVIAQAENLSNGRGITVTDFRRLLAAGVDFCTGGNWSLYQGEIITALSDPSEPIIRPANYPSGTAGLGYKYLATKNGKILVISLLGQVVGRDAQKPIDNPLQVIDTILESQKSVKKVATVVNFHGDFSSEKVVIGHYLDGRVSAVIGDHWHVPTADAMVLPKGTAHITDVGMSGSLDSSLGVTFASVIPRWRDDHKTRNVLETKGRMQFNALSIDLDDNSGLSTSTELIRQIL